MVIVFYDPDAVLQSLTNCHWGDICFGDTINHL